MATGVVTVGVTNLVVDAPTLTVALAAPGAVWNELGAVVAGESGRFEVSSGVESGAGARFYRCVSP
ncbi:MAG: hypothetical protein RI897_2469 [Verrucomicrobiota bacterium]|jgi:hypothetical protein